MAETSLAVHDAVLSKLDEDLDLPVFDHVPDNQWYPYVSLDRHVVEPQDTHSEHGSVHLMFLTVWSEHKGNAEVLKIMSAIHASLHDADLSLGTGSAVLTRILDMRTELDADGETYQGAVSVRVVTEHK